MNKYNSLTETFTSNPIYNALLSAKGTPPADIAFGGADFTGKYLYPAITAGVNPRTIFALNDHPRFVGVGLFSNMADGLVHITNPEDFDDGIVLLFSILALDAANASLGAAVVQSFKVAELNQIFDTDVLIDVSTLTAANFPGIVSFAIRAICISVTMNFSTITVDPAFAAKILTFRPVAVIEHNTVTTVGPEAP